MSPLISSTPSKKYGFLAPETGAGKGSTFHKRTQLGPYDTLGHEVPASIGAKTTIGTGDHPTPVPHRVDRLTEAIGHNFGMLDVVGRRIDYPWQKEHRVR